MEYKYLMVDSRGEPVARGVSENGPGGAVWNIRVDGGALKQVLSHEYVSLVSDSEQVPAVEGRIVSHRDNVIAVEAVRQLDGAVRRNLRMPVRFETFLYPVDGSWRGRVPALSNDLSCGGISFFCARRFQRGDLVQLVIPVTSQPLLLTARVLRERPSGEPVPLFAAEFVELLHEEEMMVREAVFSLQLDRAAG